MKKSFIRRVSWMIAALSLFTASYGQGDTLAPSLDGDTMSLSLDGDTLTLSLDEAKSFAIEHNRTIQNASLSVQKAEVNKWKAIASMLPQIKASVDYANMCGYEMSISGMNIAMPPYFTFGGTVSLAVSGTQIVNVQLAKMSKEMSEVSKKQSEQTITSNIEKSYVNILALETTIKLLEQNLQNLDSLYKMTLNAVKAGTAEQNDADQIAIQVASMKSSINSTQRTIEVLYNTIRLYIGATAEHEVILSQKLEDIINVNTILELLNSELDLSQNYDYQLLEKNTNLSKKQVTLSKMNYVPTLSAYYQYSKKEYCSDEPTMNSTPPNMVGVSLSIPIFSSGSNWAGVKSAKYDYAEAQNTLADTKESLAIQNKQLRYNLSSAYENYQIQSNNIEVMQHVFDSYSQKYKYGTASSMQLTTSGTDLVSAQSNYISSLLEMVNAHIELKVLLNK